MTPVFPTVIHLGVQVSDIERSVGFYRELLALGRITVMQGSLGPMAFIRLGRFELVLHQAGQSLVPRNPLDHFGIEVEGIGAYLERAKRLNAVTEPLHESFSWRQFNARDPDGYPFHVMEKRTSR